MDSHAMDVSCRCAGVRSRARRFDDPIWRCCRRRDDRRWRLLWACAATSRSHERQRLRSWRWEQRPRLSKMRVDRELREGQGKARRRRLTIEGMANVHPVCRVDVGCRFAVSRLRGRGRGTIDLSGCGEKKGPAGSVRGPAGSGVAAARRAPRMARSTEKQVQHREQVRSVDHRCDGEMKKDRSRRAAVGGNARGMR